MSAAEVLDNMRSRPIADEGTEIRPDRSAALNSLSSTSDNFSRASFIPPARERIERSDCPVSERPMYGPGNRYAVRKTFPLSTNIHGRLRRGGIVFHFRFADRAESRRDHSNTN